MSQADGIEVRVGMENDLLIYEMKVSIRPEEHTMAFNLNENKKFYVGIMTTEIDRQAFREKMPEGMGRSSGGYGRRGGMRGGGRGMGGRSGGRGGRPGGKTGERPDQPEPLKLWVKMEFTAAESM